MMNEELAERSGIFGLLNGYPIFQTKVSGIQNRR